MKPYETQSGYLALHALMIHIWNLGEAISSTHSTVALGDLLREKRKTEEAVQNIFDLDPDALIPDEDWDIANLQPPSDYRFEINVKPE